MGKKIQQKPVESDSEEEGIQYDQEEGQVDLEKREECMNIKIKEIQSDFKQRLKLTPKQSVNWHEHMSLVSDETVQLEKMDINDDIQREVQFYKIALDNTKLALKYLQSENIPLRRPDDYFAEMFKSDKQMASIKSRLVQQQAKVQNFEEKLLRQQSKKLSKKIKARNEFAKHKEKRDNLEAIENWKKEIATKGEKAKDLSDFMLKKQNFKKPGQQQQGKGGSQGQKPVKRNSGGGKVQNNKKTIQKGKQQQGKGRQNKRAKGNASGGKRKRQKRGHQ